MRIRLGRYAAVLKIEKNPFTRGFSLRFIATNKTTWKRLKAMKRRGKDVITK